jgi:hypothetical protein
VRRLCDRCLAYPLTKTRQAQSLASNQLKEQTMKNQILDILTALVIAAALLIGALAYFDVLTK